MLLTSRTRNLDKRHPVVIRLSEGRERKYKRAGIYCHPNEWDSKRSYPKTASIDQERALDKMLKDFKDKVSQFQAEGKEVSLNTITQEATNKKLPPKVLAYFESTIAKLKKTSLGNAEVYNRVYRSFRLFLHGHQNKLLETPDYLNRKKRFKPGELKPKDIKMVELNKSILDKYNSWLIARDVNPRSRSLNFRTLKGLFNRAVYDENVILTMESNPFGVNGEKKTKFWIGQFSKKTPKRALRAVEVAKLKALDLSGSPDLEEARDLFLFGIYGRGIDFVDIARLTHGDYKKKLKRVEYVRYKTRNITDEKIDFEVDEYIKPIIEKYSPGGKIYPKDSYIFNILNREVYTTPEQEHIAISKANTRINVLLKRVAKMADIHELISTKWTRHTFATILKKDVKASISEISELLRHGDVKTTEIYLKELEPEAKDSITRKLKQVIG